MLTTLLLKLTTIIIYHYDYIPNIHLYDYIYTIV